jgi:hypothetical protein
MYKVIEENVSFGRAIDFVKQHPDTHGIRRPDWKETHCVRAHFPTNGHSPYMYKVYIPTLFKMTWTPYEKDIFAEDWSIVLLNNNSKGDN